jgi:hypothetical protein
MMAGVAASNKNYLCCFVHVCVHQREKVVFACDKQSKDRVISYKSITMYGMASEADKLHHRP